MSIETKKIIAEAFFHILQKKNINKITVKDICDACGISRQAFYYHFQDILDLFEWTAEEKMKKAVALSLDEQDPVAALEHFVCMASGNYELIKKIMDSQRYTEFQKILIQSIQTYLTELVRYKKPEKSLSRSDIEIDILFYACGIAGLLLSYAGQEQLDTRKFAEQIYRLISSESQDDPYKMK